MTNQAVFIDPSSDHFLQDRLFNINDAQLNRDGTLLPFVRLKDHFASIGIPCFTADKLRDGTERREVNHYWSLGMEGHYQELVGRPDVRLRGFLIMEPPLVRPDLYAALPHLTAAFDEVYVHNTVGDGYSLNSVLRNKLRPLFWPQPYGDVLSPYWDNTQRKNKLVVIAGNHNPRSHKPELYSERIKAVAALSHRKGIDLFGRGWERWWSRQSLWWNYWRHRRAIMANYHGSCASKWEVLSSYRFSLCFENMPMKGYVTEKLFDCFYAGTVPVYWGAPDIETLVPPAAYVDMRKFKTYLEMLDHIQAMSTEQWQRMRETARQFLASHGKDLYYNSLIRSIQI
ncbi:MAG: glycosyltransferase family 10 [Hydrogenophaga sp.]|uniref:glycosyltransferase family 10 domain-containing protein n=1 Tax=Hydrogenophaga sp. TaxID=1904254 RepID=UPI0027369835|nr:glycosyltransferase family 10 [Hydrogenophaga sp.]MDP3349060.1 glycosyltransferase family 10 [Hydrogenophaga sp.]